MDFITIDFMDAVLSEIRILFSASLSYAHPCDASNEHAIQILTGQRVDARPERADHRPALPFGDSIRGENALIFLQVSPSK
jgi:hypothetical protein